MSNNNQAKQEKQQELLSQENTILAGVLGAIEDIETRYETVQIKRDGKDFFSFRVRPLSNKVYEEIQRKATKFKKSRTGISQPDTFSVADAHARLIVEATHPEDRKMLWDNKELWDSVSGVLAPHHLVPKVLLTGEVDAIVGVIDHVSGNSLDREDMVVKEQERIDDLKN